MVNERAAERWLRTAAHSKRTRGTRAWSRLSSLARQDEPAVRAVLARAARDGDHPLCAAAGALLADRWAATGDPELRDVVVESGALATGGTARLRTAALHGRLTEFWPPEEAETAFELLRDRDPLVRLRTAQSCAAATGPLLEALWRTVPGLAPDDFPPLVPLLLDNPGAAPPDVVDALWEAWLRRHHERLWSLLRALDRPASTEPLRAAGLIALDTGTGGLALTPAVRRELTERAKLPFHPIGVRAREQILASRSQDLFEQVCRAAGLSGDANLTAFCAAHGLAPAEPAERAAFYLLTGRGDQYRALDPDGRLLSLAYAAGDRGTRTRLQEAMREAGELDLMRILAGADRCSRVPELTWHDFRYLGDALAERGEYAELWRLVKAAPLSRGVELMTGLTSWSPPHAEEREAFRRMLHWGKPALRRALEVLKGPLPAGRVVLRVPEPAFGVSFSADGSRFAYAAGDGTVRVVALATGREAERYDGFARPPARLAHTAPGAFLAVEREECESAGDRLVRCAGGMRHLLHRTAGRVRSLVGSGRDGFAAVTTAGEIVLGAPDGSVRVLGAGDLLPRTAVLPSLKVAAEPGSGRLAFTARGLTVTDAEGVLVARDAISLGNRVIEDAVFTAADTLVTAGGSYLLRARVEGGAVVADRAGRRIPGGTATQLVARPGHGEVVLCDRRGRIHTLDAATLNAKWSTGAHTGASFLLAPSGDLLASRAEDELTVRRLGTLDLVALFEKPLMHCVPADLDAVSEHLAHGDPTALPEPADRAVRLLHDMLALRFGSDIELSAVTVPAPREDDIAL